MVQNSFEDRQQAIAAAMISQANNVLAGKIKPDHLLDVIRLILGEGYQNLTKLEVKNALNATAHRRKLDTMFLDVILRIGARLTPPPLPTDTSATIVQRAAEQGDEEAIRLLASDSIDEFFNNEIVPLETFVKMNSSK